MLYIYRYLWIDPTNVSEFVIYHRDIALILSVNHGGIASLINTCKGIIIPYLIICDAALSINLTLSHRLVYSNSVYFCYVDNIIRYVNVHSLLSHDKLLS